MREYDVAIVGAGLAGSIAATMLARAGHSVALVDPHPTYPDEFRCEKLDFDQIAILHKASLGDAVLRAATHDRSTWVSRLGRLVEKRPSDHLGIDYGRLVNTLRAEIPPEVAVIRGTARAVASGSDRQHVTLAGGETVTARLAVLASGLGNSLRESLGVSRVDLGRCYSITIGFDVEPAHGGSFPFRALTYYGEHPRSRIGYLTLFPIGARLRANLFVYRDLSDPWLKALRTSPETALQEALPRLARLTGPFRVVGPVRIRPIDLYATEGYVRPGVVLVGDAFGTACPAAGTGARKAVIDVERLCNGYVSRWLATPGMGADKIAAFYDDAEKVRSDRDSLALARSAKAMATDGSALWWARRSAAVALGLTRWAGHSARDAWHGAVRPPVPARSPEPHA